MKKQKDKLKQHLRSSKILFLFVLILASLPALASYKYNEQDNSHLIDGRLIVDSIESSSLNIDGNIQGAVLKGDGRQLINLPISSEGWQKNNNIISLEDSSKTVAIGGPAAGAKLDLYGDLRINGSAFISRLGTAASQSFWGNSQADSVKISSANRLDLSASSDMRQTVSSQGTSPNSRFRWLAAGNELMLMTPVGLAINKAFASEAVDVNGSVKAGAQLIGDASQLTNLNTNEPNYQANFTCVTVIGGSGTNQPSCNLAASQCMSVFAERPSGRSFVACDTASNFADATSYVKRCCASSITII